MTSRRRSPRSYFETNDCGRLSALESCCCVMLACLRCSISNASSSWYGSEWMDFKVRRQKRTGGLNKPLLGLSQNRFLGIIRGRFARMCKATLLSIAEKDLSVLKKTLIFATSVMLSAPTLAEVKADCSTKMNGSTRCEFMNNGVKKDSSCVVIEVARDYDADVYSVRSAGGKGAVLASETICSGLVEPQDIRERTPTGSFTAGGRAMTPFEFCKSDNPWFKAPSNCTMTTKVVAN